MAGHPQTTPRGLWAGDMQYGSFTVDSNSSGITIDGKIKLNGQKHIGANSTAFVLDTVAALPSTRVVGGLVIVSNSTGKALAFHQTGTTWQYANVTSVQPS